MLLLILFCVRRRFALMTLKRMTVVLPYGERKSFRYSEGSDARDVLTITRVDIVNSQLWYINILPTTILIGRATVCTNARLATTMRWVLIIESKNVLEGPVAFSSGQLWPSHSKLFEKTIEEDDRKCHETKIKRPFTYCASESTSWPFRLSSCNHYLLFKNSTLTTVLGFCVISAAP